VIPFSKHQNASLILIQGRRGCIGVLKLKTKNFAENFSTVPQFGFIHGKQSNKRIVRGSFLINQHQIS
jgi:hypothetical protein